jgi:hypothetical protein
VPLLTTPLGQVTYEQVIEFCKTFAEGVRVEYKREPGNKTPKVVSSFANTVGGVWVIGVDVDKKTNMAILPPAGLSLEPGIEERITQSALMGVAPSITPALRVFEIPDKPGLALVVVKIPESIEAPHAIENSTRVFVRNASTTEPYELADIDRIEYLLQRRRDSAGLRERLIKRAADRSFYGSDRHRIRVVVCPVFPKGTLFSHDELWERAEDLRLKNNRHLRDFRLVHDAVASPRASGGIEFYFECSVQGVVYYEGPASLRGEVKGIPFVMLPQLISPLAQTINTAIPLLRGQLTNVLIRYELYGWEGRAFLLYEPFNMSWSERIAEESRCIDAHVSVETTVVAEELVESRPRLLIELLQELLWAFNCRSAKLPELVYATAKEEGLL